MLSRLPKIYICLYNGMFYSNENEQTRATCACLHTKSLQSCLFLWNFMDCTCQAPLSMGFSRQEFWSRLPCPPSDQGIRPMSLTSPVLVGGFFITNATWEGPRATCSNMDKSNKHNMSKKINKRDHIARFHFYKTQKKK